MKITLETVRSILKEALGFNSFIASFITEVREDPACPTACITRDGRLSYSPEFAGKYLESNADLFSLIFHELLHPMFGHFIHDAGEIEGIAADAVINAVISTGYGTESKGGRLFQKTHDPRGLTGLMRPLSLMRSSRYNKVYDRLYEIGPHQSRSAFSTGELIQTLKILTPGENLDLVLLLGSHGGEGKSGLRGVGSEILGRIAEEIQQSVLGRGGRHAGFSESLLGLLMEALRTNLSIRKALLGKFLTKRKVDRFKQMFRDRRVSVSPIPIHPSKRDLVLLAAGLHPAYFHGQASCPRKRERGLAIYLDVSGSVNEVLPKILGILNNLRREITSVFLFSNQVVETSFETLLKGCIQTTYGTDFDCIARSILEKGFEKAVIITDGFASMDPELQEQLTSRKLQTLTILFESGQECEDFAPFGDIVHLDDICEGERR